MAAEPDLFSPDPSRVWSIPPGTDFLRALACQRGQGYLFAKPMPRDEFAQLVWRRSDRDEETGFAALVDPLAA